jgi:CubicO group peptidase (beta-lactamase class C family)
MSPASGHRRRLIGALLGALLCTAAPARAQNVSTRLDEIIRFYSDDKKTFMGTVLVARDGKPILSAGYGFANVEWSVPNTPATKFRIGSMTAQFTAAAILLLEERGKLRLDDPLKKYLPDIPAAWQGVTIQHLLAHTSGIPSYSQVPEYRTVRAAAATPDKVIALVRDRPLEFRPGERVSESNSGYLLLGFVVDRVAGVPYPRFVRDNLLMPVEMFESGFEGNAMVMRLASGYSPSSAGPVNADYVHMTLPYSAGGLYATSGNLLKWSETLFSRKVLNAAALQKMLTPVRDTQALGLSVRTVNGRRVISSAGSIEGFSSVLDFYPETRITVIVLSNLATTIAGELAAQLGGAAQGDEVQLTYQRQEVSLPAAALKRYVGTYELAPKINLTIALRGNQLTAQLTGQTVFPLFAESENRFFFKVVDAQIDFPADDNGELTYLVFHQNGRDLKAIRK